MGREELSGKKSDLFYALNFEASLKIWTIASKEMYCKTAYVWNLLNIWNHFNFANKFAESLSADAFAGKAEQ